MTQPSHEIAVKKYRHILIWPLLLRGKPLKDPKLPLVQRWANQFASGGWKPHPPERKKAGEKLVEPPVYQTSDGFGYEEIVYFHPFVRDFLYGDGKTKPKDRAVHHLSFDKAKRVRVTFTSFRFVKGREETVTLELKVDRVELYLCKPNVALFVVEVSSPKRVRDGKATDEEVKLAQVLDFQDQFRRIYPPFWYDPKEGDPEPKPGLCPTAVEWLDGTDNLLAPHDCTEKPDTFKEFTRDGAEPPVFWHWQYFLKEAKLVPMRTRHEIDDGTLCYQQIVDERIPAMTYLGVDDPTALTDGDMDRLTFLDAAGTDDFPYQKEFLAERRKNYTYDRFWDYGTRYLCSGYGFTLLGEYGDDTFDKILQGHFRTHYFRLGLIAHYLRAALLGFADELSESIKKLAGPGDANTELGNPAFRRRVEEIQFAFLKFRSRAWFPEVTNQLQGSELYAIWFKHLNIGTLFQQVDETSERLHDVLTEYETRQLSRTQDYLTKFASVFLPLSLVFSFLSVLYASDFLPKVLDGKGADTPQVLSWLTAGFALLGGILGLVLVSLVLPKRR